MASGCDMHHIVAAELARNWPPAFSDADTVEPVRLISWNVNSIRSRHERLVALLTRHEPDVVAIQETKCDDATFAELAKDYQALGFATAHHGVDHWNGVAILSRRGLDDVRIGFPGANQPPYDEARLISADCDGLRVHSIYVPNGRELDNPHYLFKLVWLERLRTALNPDLPTLALGDFNVAPADIDIYDPKRFRRRTHASPAERAAIDALIADGFIDVTRSHSRDPGIYTFWNYRPGMFEANRGLRIDLALASSDVAAQTVEVWIDRDERQPARSTNDAVSKPSDHAPLVVDLA